MTDYVKKSFSVAVGSKEYRDNWDRVFAKPTEPSCHTCNQPMVKRHSLLLEHEPSPLEWVCSKCGTRRAIEPGSPDSVL